MTSDGGGEIENVKNYRPSDMHFHLRQQPSRQFWDCGRRKSDSLWNHIIVGCQWTVNCLLGDATLLKNVRALYIYGVLGKKGFVGF